MTTLLVALGLLLTGDYASLAAPLDSLLKAEARAGFSGSVLLACGESVQFEGTFGAAAATGVPPERLAFWLASDSKQFTATAIMALQDRGRLHVTDSLERFFANVPADKRPITIHQLLTHTSGLPTAYRAEGITDRNKAVGETLRLRLDSKPGEKFSYSNDGYVLLAALVEIASGLPFDRFLQDSLFAPAGLEHTGLWGSENPNVPLAPLSKGHGPMREAVWKNGHSVANWGYRGPGGAYATPRDMLTWIRALQAGRVLSPAAYRELLGRHVRVRADSTGESWTAYGWGVRVVDGKDVSYAHAGDDDALGHSSILRFEPGGRVIVVLANSGDVGGGSWAERVSRDMRRLLETRPPCGP
jgi:CubicO group peptidase (beta-lactamase class C family)